MRNRKTFIYRELFVAEDGLLLPLLMTTTTGMSF
jgi:hypothetical protein